MYVKQVVLFVLFYVSYCCSVGTRIRFLRTSFGKNGFTLFPKVGIKKMITFECPSNLKESYIFINEFSAPKTLEALVIKNCKTLTIFLRCTKYPWKRKNMKSLHISNIETLKIQNTPGFQTLLPPNVIFENIGNIESIPANTFTQINRLTNHARCFLPSSIFHSLHFRNVSINTVLGQAFHMPNNFGNITFTNTRIKTLESSSFVVNHESKGVFLFENSVVDFVKPSAIHVTGQKVVFTRNKFGEISSSGLRAQATSFVFAYNSVEKFLHPEALTVGSHHAVVSSNHFKHLKTRAFSAMSGSAGRLSTYEFSGNNIEFVEDNCLLPSMNAYKTILNQITIKKNKFSCECPQAGALLLRMDKKSGDSITNAFYEIVFDGRSENTCTSTCNLPLASAKGKIDQGKCVNAVTIASLCAEKMKPKVKTVIATPKSVILPTKLQKIIPSKIVHPSIKNVMIPKAVVATPPKSTKLPVTPPKSIKLPVTPPKPIKPPVTPPKPIKLPVTPPKPVKIPVTPPKPVKIPVTPPKPVKIPVTPPKPVKIPVTPPKPIKLPVIPPKPVKIPVTPPKPIKLPVTPPKPIKLPVTPPKPVKIPVTPPKPMKLPVTPPKPVKIPVTPPKPIKVSVTPPKPIKLPVTPPKPIKLPPKPTSLPTKLQQPTPPKVSHPIIPAVKNVIIPIAVAATPPKPIKPPPTKLRKPNVPNSNIPAVKNINEIKTVTPLKLIPIKNNVILNIPPTIKKTEVKVFATPPKPIILSTRSTPPPTNLKKPTPSKVSHSSISALKNVIISKTATVTPPNPKASSKPTPTSPKVLHSSISTVKNVTIPKAVTVTPPELVPIKNSTTLNIRPTKEKTEIKVVTASPKFVLPTKATPFPTKLQKPIPPKIVHPSISAVKNTIVTLPKLMPVNNSSTLNIPPTKQKTEDKMFSDSLIPPTFPTRPSELPTPSYIMHPVNRNTIIHKMVTIIPINLLPIKSNTSLNISSSSTKRNTTINLLKSTRLPSNETKLTFSKVTTILPITLLLSKNNLSFKVPSSSTETKKDEVEVATIAPISTTIPSTFIQTTSSKITNLSDKLLTKNNISFTSVKSLFIFSPMQTNNMSADFTTNEKTAETTETISVLPENHQETTFTTLSSEDLLINGYSSSLETSSLISSLSSTSLDFITDEQELEISDTTSELPIRNETTTSTIIPTENVFTESSSSSLEVSSKSLPERTSNNISIFTSERELGYNKTSSLLPTKQYNLTTTPMSVTILPSTKYKSRESTDNIQLFTSQETDYVTSDYKVHSSISDEEYITVTNNKISVETTTSSLRSKMENSSKTYFLPSSLLLLCFSINFV